MEFAIKFYGHENVRATHKTTLEITKEEHLTPKGDCIIGVRASASVKDLPEELKKKVWEGGKLEFILEVSKERFTFYAFGHRELALSHPLDIVIRKSSFLSDRTLAIKSTAAAIDIPRDIVNLLKMGKEGKLIIIY